jgi:hypothetical protein
MGLLPPPAFEALRAAAEPALASALARGEYVGWLLTPEGEPGSVVAGAGVQLRDVLPHPVDLAGGWPSSSCATFSNGPATSD